MSLSRLGRNLGLCALTDNWICGRKEGELFLQIFLRSWGCQAFDKPVFRDPQISSKPQNSILCPTKSRFQILTNQSLKVDLDNKVLQS